MIILNPTFKLGLVRSFEPFSTALHLYSSKNFPDVSYTVFTLQLVFPFSRDLLPPKAHFSSLPMKLGPVRVMSQKGI